MGALLICEYGGDSLVCCSSLILSEGYFIAGTSLTLKHGAARLFLYPDLGKEDLFYLVREISSIFTPFLQRILINSPSMWLAIAIGMSSFENLSIGTWKPFFEESVVILLESITQTIDESGQDIEPHRSQVLRMFVMVPLERIKVVIIGQNLYPYKDAYGIPFVSRRGNITKSLDILRREVEMEYIRKCNFFVFVYGKR